MSTTQRRLRSTAVPLAFMSVMGGLFAACGEEEETAYCVDANNVVVDNEQCGDEDSGGSGGFFWFFAGRSLAGGAVTKGTRLTGGAGSARIVSTDKSAIAARGGLGGGPRAGGVGRGGAGQ